MSNMLTTADVESGPPASPSPGTKLRSEAPRWSISTQGRRLLRRLWCNSDTSVCYARVFDEHVPMRKLKDIDGLFNGCHFDREVIVLCVRCYALQSIKRGLRIA
jgi:hypothetical protein